METAKKWDVDDDGIIDNGGFADQTFDAWTMTGARYGKISALNSLMLLCYTIIHIYGISNTAYQNYEFSTETTVFFRKQKKIDFACFS